MSDAATESTTYRRLLVKRIAARDFRNYAHVETLLSDGWTVLIGQNGAGKTNFLELLVLNLQGVSFRGKLNNLLRWGTKETKIVADLSSGEKISTHVFWESNGLKHNRQMNECSMGSIQGEVPPVVLFIPQEEYLLDSPAGRRKILSRGLLLQSQLYRRHFLQYQRVLKQRNALLRMEKFHTSSSGELDVWTDALIGPMLDIWRMREEFLKTMNENLPAVIKKIGGINLALKAQIILGGMPQGTKADEISPRDVVARFREIRDREKELGATLIGPHRDLFSFQHDGRDVLPLLSRGQRRLLLLALHIVEGEYAAKSCMTAPLFVLDDIFSELDPKHRSAIGVALAGEQVVVTTAEEKILPKLSGDPFCYFVKNGKMEKHSLD